MTFFEFIVPVIALAVAGAGILVLRRQEKKLDDEAMLSTEESTQPEGKAAGTVKGRSRFSKPVKQVPNARYRIPSAKERKKPSAQPQPHPVGR